MERGEIGVRELGCCGAVRCVPSRSDFPLHLPLQRLQHNTTPHSIRRPGSSERISATRSHKHKHVHLPTSSQTEALPTEETQLSRSISLGPRCLIGPLAESPSEGHQLAVAAPHRTRNGSYSGHLSRSASSFASTARRGPLRLLHCTPSPC